MPDLKINDSLKLTDSLLLVSSLIFIHKAKFQPTCSHIDKIRSPARNEKKKQILTGLSQSSNFTSSKDIIVCLKCMQYLI